jgi:hypothetical protein
MDDNSFECPQCGAKIYPEMSRCPQCGQNLYPEDELESQASQESTAPKWMISSGAVLVGWLLSSGFVALVNILVATLSSQSAIGLAAKVVLMLVGPVGAFAGSYVAAAIYPKYAAWLGAVIGVLDLPVLALFATRWVQVDISTLLSLWAVVVAALTLLSGLFGAWLHYKLTLDTGWKEKWQVRGWEDLLYQDLLRKVRFNGSVAERLIEYERQQDPSASRLQLIQNAIERWERDNR